MRRSERRIFLKRLEKAFVLYSAPSYDLKRYDIIAWEKSDQILYISPSNDTVILRTGKTDGGVSDWVGALKERNRLNLARNIKHIYILLGYE